MATRRSVRAILIDDSGRLVLVRRVRPGGSPYWVTPGGGIEPSDDSPVSALRRELREELGAEADILSELLVDRTDDGAGVAIQHFYLTRLISLDAGQRTGAEFQDPARGCYAVERVDLHGNALDTLDLRPPVLKRFVLSNAGALLKSIGRCATCPNGEASRDKT